MKKNSGLFFLLQSALALKSMPARIEGYDISTPQARIPPVPWSFLRTEKSARSQYRHFILNSDPGGDDYGAMREVLSRRFMRLKEQAKGFEARPDLILIDGGAAHAFHSCGGAECFRRKHTGIRNGQRRPSPDPGADYAGRQGNRHQK